MPSFRLKIGDLNVGRKYERAMLGRRSGFLKATADTIHELGQEMLAQGRADMAGAGNFSSDRWQSGLVAAEDVGPDRSTLTISHLVPYWRVFEFGAVIKGNPLLWIPLSFSDAVGIMARDYAGGLFRVDRKSGGAPLLLSIQDKKPKYFGKESVTIPKKFHLRQIMRGVWANFRSVFNSHLKD
jgi:hypothetical protein